MNTPCNKCCPLYDECLRCEWNHSISSEPNPQAHDRYLKSLHTPDDSKQVPLYVDDLPF